MWWSSKETSVAVKEQEKAVWKGREKEVCLRRRGWSWKENSVASKEQEKAVEGSFNHKTHIHMTHTHKAYTYLY